MSESSTPLPHKHTVTAAASIIVKPIRMQPFRNIVFE